MKSTPDAWGALVVLCLTLFIVVLALGWSLVEGIAAALVPLSMSLIIVDYSGAKRALAFHEPASRSVRLLGNRVNARSLVSIIPRRPPSRCWDSDAPHDGRDLVETADAIRRSDR